MKKPFIGAFLVAALVMWAGVCAAEVGAPDPLEGFWQSVDENTGEVTAWWEFVVTDEGLRGTIIKVPDEPDDIVCDKCTGDFRNVPIIGTEWLQLGTRNRDGSWEGGFIIDSKTGKQYRAKVWLDGEDLKLRGYIGFLYRTQTWNRADDPRQNPSP